MFTINTRVTIIDRILVAIILNIIFVIINSLIRITESIRISIIIFAINNEIP